MKPLRLILAACSASLLGCVPVFAAMLQNAAIPAPAVVTGSTNLTPSAATSLALDEKLPAANTAARVYATWTGPGTTTLTLVTTGDGTNWDSAASSSFTLTGSEGRASDWFQFVGVKRVALGAVTNSVGAISNLTLRLFYAPN